MCYESLAVTSSPTVQSTLGGRARCTTNVVPSNVDPVLEAVTFGLPNQTCRLPARRPHPRQVFVSHLRWWTLSRPCKPLSRQPVTHPPRECLWWARCRLAWERLAVPSLARSGRGWFPLRLAGADGHYPRPHHVAASGWLRSRCQL
jgi:hypothetical protein